MLHTYIKQKHQKGGREIHELHGGAAALLADAYQLRLLLIQLVDLLEFLSHIRGFAKCLTPLVAEHLLERVQNLVTNSSLAQFG